MRIVLLNSAMMPTPGLTYRPREITADAYAATIKLALDEGWTVDSYIGYETTVNVIEQLTGWRPPLSRSQSVVHPGDLILVSRLRYRAEDPAMKRDAGFQSQIKLEDFEFWSVQVSE